MSSWGDRGLRDKRAGQAPPGPSASWTKRPALWVSVGSLAEAGGGGWRCKGASLLPPSDPGERVPPYFLPVIQVNPPV